MNLALCSEIAGHPPWKIFTGIGFCTRGVSLVTHLKSLLIMAYPEGDVIQPVLYNNWQIRKTRRDQQPVNILPGNMPKIANIISPQSSKC